MMNRVTTVKKISIISPCYNEEENVAECWNTVKNIFDNELPGYELEYVFVDNNSSDNTVEILRRIAEEHSCVKVVVNSRNFGVFRSTFNGLSYSTGDATLVMLPVDLQDPPERLPEFVRLWEQGYDVVAGARSTREESVVMRACRWLFYWMVNTFSNFELSPDVGEFQLIDRRVLEAVLAHKDNYPYIRGIIASCGFRRIIVPYTWKVRKRGVTKHNFLALIDQALNGIFAFTRAPMRMCTLVGAVLSVLCILFALFSVGFYFFAENYAPRGTTTLIVAIFLLSGVQLLFIGMLGEYVTAIHSQVRGGPMVVERERINIDSSGVALALDSDYRQQSRDNPKAS